MQKNKYMLTALRLAQKGLGQVSPNPQVGCVIVKDDKIVGEGFHQKFGEAHAEVNALKNAKNKAKSAEMYITLEPCCHYGKTPPCTEAILKAGIQKVYIAMLDPNPLVAGKGIEFLRQNGVEVEVGILEKKARTLNEAFIHYIQIKRPFVALKLATTANGKITRSDGEQWITNEKSLEKVHHLRHEYDAILVGKNTVLADNPSLTTYKLKNAKNPVRILLDSNLTLKTDRKVFADSNFILVTKLGHSSEKKQKYLDKGGQILEVESLKQMLEKLGKMGIASLLVEGGAEVYRSFLKANLVQKMYWFQSPFETGENALGVEDVLEKFDDLKDFAREEFGEDVLTIGYL